MLKQVGGTGRPLDTRRRKGGCVRLQGNQCGTITGQECYVGRHHDIPIIREAPRIFRHQSLLHVGDSGFSATIVNPHLPRVEMRNGSLANRQFLVLLQIGFDRGGGCSILAARGVHAPPGV